MISHNIPKSKKYYCLGNTYLWYKPLLIYQASTIMYSELKCLYLYEYWLTMVCYFFWTKKKLAPFCMLENWFQTNIFFCWMNIHLPVRNQEFHVVSCNICVRCWLRQYFSKNKVAICIFGHWNDEKLIYYADIMHKIIKLPSKWVLILQSQKLRPWEIWMLEFKHKNIVRCDGSTCKWWNWLNIVSMSIDSTRTWYCWVL